MYCRARSRAFLLFFSPRALRRSTPQRQTHCSRRTICYEFYSDPLAGIRVVTMYIYIYVYGLYVKGYTRAIMATSAAPNVGGNTCSDCYFYERPSVVVGHPLPPTRTLLSSLLLLFSWPRVVSRVQSSKRIRKLVEYHSVRTCFCSLTGA